MDKKIVCIQNRAAGDQCMDNYVLQTKIQLFVTETIVSPNNYK